MAAEITLSPTSPATAKVTVGGKPGTALFAGCPELIGTPFAYDREEEIYGEGEEAEFVYKVVRGAVRTHKVLNDGRRQITGFHCPATCSAWSRARRIGTRPRPCRTPRC